MRGCNDMHVHMQAAKSQSLTATDPNHTSLCSASTFAAQACTGQPKQPAGGVGGANPRTPQTAPAAHTYRQIILTWTYLWIRDARAVKQRASAGSGPRCTACTVCKLCSHKPDAGALNHKYHNYT
jgi:hypothetical protein